VAAVVALRLTREDWNWARSSVERIVEQRTGRRLELAGDLKVRLGWRVSAVEARNVRLANAEWAGREDLFAAERVAFELPTWRALGGDFALERLELERASLRLVRNELGEGSWELGGEKSGEPVMLPVAILLREVDLSLVDPARPQGFRLRVSELGSRRTGWTRLVRGVGVYQDELISLRGAVLGTPRAGEETPVRGTVRVGETIAAAAGTLGDDSGTRLFDLAIDVRGRSLDDFWRLVGFPLPQSPPFTLAGHLSYADDVVALDRFALRLGRSDLRGELWVMVPRGRRMWIDADVRSHAIDLDDLEGFWGRPPREEKEGEPPAPAGAPRSLFPDRQLDFAKLRVADARIRFAAGKIQGKSVLDDVRLAATLERGLLELQPLRLGMSAGELDVRGHLDARGGEARLDGEILIRGVDLAELLSRADVREAAGGRFGGRAEIRSRGNSLHDLVRHLDGEIGAALQDGWVSDPLLELVALHLGGYIRAKLDKEEPGPIRCLVGLADAKDGRLDFRTLLLDTAHVRIEGEGSIDLAKESIDLELEQDSKHVTFGALQTPIQIVGPLVSRTARLKPGPLVARGGAAIAIGAAIHPLAALVALIDPGSDDRPGACAEAISEYRTIATSSRR
jgi:uncharacterized protein involved in outer membrane biogenesis